MQTTLNLGNNGDTCNSRGSCGHYSPNPKSNHCDPKRCLEAKLRLINSTVGDN